MITLFDFLFRGRSHLQFNHSVLRILSAAYPDEEIAFSAHTTHLNAFAELPGLPANIQTTALPETAFAVREASEDWAVENIGALDYLRARQPDGNILVLGARPWFINALRQERRLFERGTYDVILHANLAQTAFRRPLNPLRRRRDMFGVLRTQMPAALRFVLLESAVERRFRSLVRPSTKSAVLPLPCSESLGQTMPTDRPKKLQIGFIGNAIRTKGFEIFRQSAALSRTHADFHCIGQVTADYQGAQDELFLTPPNKEKLPQMEYESRIAELDLVCLPLDPRWYRWCASATLFDSIRAGVPPITVRTETVSEIAAQYGRFGYVVDDAADIPRLISELDRARLTAELPQMRSVMRQIAADRSIGSIAQNFRLHRL